MQTPHHTPETTSLNQAALKARGLRPVVLWVPDTQRLGFAEEVRRQLAVVEADADDRDTLEFIDAAADWSE